MSETERPDWAQGEIDLSRPSIARVYDYWLGGAHNFAVDREAGQKIQDAMPEVREVITANRALLRRAVRYLLTAGVRQFLDLGSGIPTVGNVHEVAQQGNPEARVVYVDNDPVAVTHSRAILSGNSQVAVLRADARHADAVLGSPEVTRLFDFTEPIAVLMIALVHFIPDSDEPGRIIGRYRDKLASGSYLAISHFGFDPDEETPGARQAGQDYSRTVNQIIPRSRSEVSAFFTGFELVDPGVARIPLWRPVSLDELDDDAAKFPGFAAVGRKP